MVSVSQIYLSFIIFIEKLSNYHSDFCHFYYIHFYCFERSRYSSNFAMVTIINDLKTCFNIFEEAWVHFIDSTKSCN